MNIEMLETIVQNPFQKTEETDIVFHVEKHKLHLHKDILSIYSPVFKAKLREDLEYFFDKEHVEDLIDFFKFFYPHLNPRLTDNSNFTGLLELCQEHQIGWLIRKIDDYLSLSNIYADNNNNITINLHGLIMADRYKLPKIRAKLLAFKNTTPIGNLHQVNGFQHLREETIFLLNMQRLPSIVNSDKQGDSCIIRTSLEEIYYSRNKNMPPQEPFDSNIEQPFPEDANSDVIVKINKEQLHLHSPILSLYSSIFKEMLQKASPVDGKYLIEINGKALEHVVEMFMFLYADKCQKLSSDIDIAALLSLCKEYEIKWLTSHIEEFLVSSRRFTFGSQKNLEGLKIAETFNLTTLKSMILNCRLGSLKELRRYAEYEHLSEHTRYELAKKEILRLKNNSVQNECMKVIGYLDEIFLTDN